MYTNQTIPRRERPETEPRKNSLPRVTQRHRRRQKENWNGVTHVYGRLRAYLRHGTGVHRFEPARGKTRASGSAYIRVPAAALSPLELDPAMGQGRERPRFFVWVYWSYRYLWMPVDCCALLVV